MSHQIALLSVTTVAQTTSTTDPLSGMWVFIGLAALVLGWLMSSDPSRGASWDFPGFVVGAFAGAFIVGGAAFFLGGETWGLGGVALGILMLVMRYINTRPRKS